MDDDVIRNKRSWFPDSDWRFLGCLNDLGHQVVWNTCCSYALYITTSPLRIAKRMGNFSNLLGYRARSLKFFSFWERPLTVKKHCKTRIPLIEKQRRKREREDTNTQNFLQKKKLGSWVMVSSVSYWFFIEINKRCRSLTKVLLGGLEMCPFFTSFIYLH